MPHRKSQDIPDAPTLNKHVYVKPELVRLADTDVQGNKLSRSGEAMQTAVTTNGANTSTAVGPS